MGYTMGVTMRDQDGAITRLLLLLSQRNLKIAHLTVRRESPGTVTAVVAIDDAADRGPWALRQVTRHKDLLEARLLEGAGPAGAGPAGKEADLGQRYRYRRSRQEKPHTLQGGTPHDRKLLLRRTRRSSMVNG
ncbi:MAG: hypothetical protein K6U14_08005 [Firmicutes bacterium]|nr:hypothetical protein [Alicyclobacillaceae bacterium]MCL6497558.1 hypothetical protein [Bacillota bacterium]